MADKKCPRCGIWSVENALRCDCGYDFVSGEVKESYLSTENDPAYLNYTESKGKGFLQGFIAGFVGGFVFGGLGVFAIWPGSVLRQVILVLLALGLGYFLYRIIVKHFSRQRGHGYRYTNPGSIVGFIFGALLTFSVVFYFIALNS